MFAPCLSRATLSNSKKGETSMTHRNLLLTGAIFVLLAGVSTLWAQLPEKQTRHVELHGPDSPALLSGLHNHGMAGINHEHSAEPGGPVAAARYVFGRLDLPTGSHPDAVAIGAFQAGGPPSMAIANGLAGTVSVLLASPDGSFQSHVDYALGGNYCFSVVAADFNGDKKLDLAVTCATSGTISVLLGNGDGTFQPAANYSAGDWPTGLTAATSTMMAILIWQSRTTRATPRPCSSATETVPFSRRSPIPRVIRRTTWLRLTSTATATSIWQL